MPTTPIIALLTDFGQRENSVGVMRGVILGIAPDARLVDITHDVPPQDIVTGAWALATAWRYFPAGTIFLCVVDPGVGSARLPIALRAGDRSFVGPDNGLCTPMLESGEPVMAVALTEPRWQRPNPAPTFHGRDIFAPAAAHLAAGVPLETLGAPLAPDRLITLAFPQPAWQGDVLHGEVVHVDQYGNLITNIAGDLAAAVLATPASVLRLGAHTITARGRAFADGEPGQPMLFLDSSGFLAIAVRDASAADALAAGRGDVVRVENLTEPHLTASDMVYLGANGDTRDVEAGDEPYDSLDR
jgi:hypothetical protein